MNKELENKITNDLNEIAKKHNFIGQFGDKHLNRIRVRNDIIEIEDSFSKSHDSIGLRLNIETKEIEITSSNQIWSDLHFEIINYFKKIASYIECLNEKDLDIINHYGLVSEDEGQLMFQFKEDYQSVRNTMSKIGIHWEDDGNDREELPKE